jgi:hypothetical protein
MDRMLNSMFILTKKKLENPPCHRFKDLMEPSAGLLNLAMEKNHLLLRAGNYLALDKYSIDTISDISRLLCNLCFLKTIILTNILNEF